jgi:hypothetical protein
LRPVGLIKGTEHCGTERWGHERADFKGVSYERDEWWVALAPLLEEARTGHVARRNARNSSFDRWRRRFRPISMATTSSDRGL